MQRPMELTDLCKSEFLKSQKWYVRFLPKFILNLLIIRWFNVSTKIPVDIQHWRGDGFEYAVTDPSIDRVFLSSRIAGNRHKDYDFVCSLAIKKANQVYNLTNTTFTRIK